MVKIRNLETGVDLCLKNAKQLIADAELVFEHGSYGHATSLVYLGLACMRARNKIAYHDRI